MLQFIQRFVRLLLVLRAANKPLLAIFRKGFSVASTEIIFNVKKHCPELSTVIDVGANKGQFALAVNAEYPQANIYSFEPLPEVFLELQKNCEHNERCKTFNTALGSQTGQIKFYKTGYSLASSALRPSRFHEVNTDYSTDVSIIEVPVRRLDELEEAINFCSPVLLKLDVQGFEKEVIKGADIVLKKVDFILIEVSFVSMYDNEPLFMEMHDFLSSLGFVLITPLSAFQNSDLQILQLDLLYRK